MSEMDNSSVTGDTTGPNILEETEICRGVVASSQEEKSTPVQNGSDGRELRSATVGPQPTKRYIEDQSKEYREKMKADNARKSRERRKERAQAKREVPTITSSGNDEDDDADFLSDASYDSRYLRDDDVNEEEKTLNEGGPPLEVASADDVDYRSDELRNMKLKATEECDGLTEIQKIALPLRKMIQVVNTTLPSMTIYSLCWHV